MKNKIKIAFIGGGNMAYAIVSSMTDPASRAVLKNNGDILDITVADPEEAQLMRFKSVCAVTTDNAAAVTASDYVFLCVKPQCALTAIEPLRALLSDKTVVSIMAGVSLDRLFELTGACRIVRVMPNLNARVGESYSAYAMRGDGINEREIQSMLGCFGTFSRVDESKFDAVTGISGSGPAFVFAAIKAFCDEAVAQGFDKAAAKDMVVQTFLGSVLNFEKSSEDISKLISSVCSKGGTTIEGVTHLSENGFENILRTAISKAVNRSVEMGKQL